MPTRVRSFAPGPSMLPDEVLTEYQASIAHYADTGLGILELGHRSGQFEQLYNTTVERLRALIGIPAGYELLLLHGGARFQFMMLPANHLGPDAVADYLVTGHFAAAAAAEAAVYGYVNIAASTHADCYLRLPSPDETSLTPTARYVHYTSNNTEMGTQFKQPPSAPPGTWLACDASSDLLTRSFDIARHGLIYATSHKNLGTAGVAFVVVRADLLEPVRQLPPFLSYFTHAQAGSRFNTPPVTAIFVLNLMANWTSRQGGVAAMETLSTAKSQLLYRTIDDSDFYTGLVDRDNRSRVNVTFALPTAELEAEFQTEAARQGLVGLWGYRKVGHLRASLFNAISLDTVGQLAEFMEQFARAKRRRLPRHLRGGEARVLR
ncbi:3-phosphoserine/phosphohydroxythreonine transaminase [Micromonospora sp. NPDC049240]|uniref:3-phosphoserine/phosphohydroxythreonine transaminase n=1 Tax=Micromonospora sp. NPDC049240 TaxID=3155151 RepID=UPI0033DFA83D